MTLMASNKENQQPERTAVIADFDSLTVVELKRFLKDHGEYVSGTKAELVKRAKGTRELRKKTLNVLRTEDEFDANQQNFRRFMSPLGEKLPNPATLISGWATTDKIPMFTYNELYNYLVLSKQRTLDLEENNAKRQLKAKVFYEDRHVHSIEYHDITVENSHCFVKALVIPSFPTRAEKQQPDYKVWISMAKQTGRVHSAGCDCSAGEGESCNHVAALLFALVDISEMKTDGLNASTSKECKWNQPRKIKLTPQKSGNMTFKKYKWIEKGTDKSKDCRRVILAQDKPTPVNVTSFEEALRKCAPHTAWLQTRKNTPTILNHQSLPILHDICFQYSDRCSLEDEKISNFFENYFQSRKVTIEDSMEIERLTRGQYKNKKWHKARLGRITASNFGSICKRNKSNLATSIIKSVCGYNSFDNKAVKWGRDHEPAARMRYTRTIQKAQLNAHVIQCGLCVNTKYPTLGASPDGIIKVGQEKEGILEVKCPYKWRESTVQEAAKDAQFCCTSENGVVKLKKNHIYFCQIQGQMAITETKWCDFVIWTLKDFHMQRVYFNPGFWDHCLTEINSFYLKFILPELFTSRLKRGKPLYC